MLTPAQLKGSLPLRMTRSALALLCWLALAPPALADVPPPHPLGHRSITRQHQFRGASRWPDQVFFVWPVLPTAKPCACSADVIGEGGTARDRGLGRCIWLDKAEGGQQETERTALPRPRLMALPKAAFARLALETLDIAATPEGAVVAATPLTEPRWVPRADPVLDEREQDDLVFDGQSLSWRPVALSYLYRDGQFVTLPARADGRLPPPPPQLGVVPPLSYQLAVQPTAELAEWRFYLASQERLVQLTYVQDGWVELQPGVPQEVTTRKRLPLLLAWPRDRGPLPAGAMAVAQPGEHGQVVLLSAGEFAELKGALFGRSLFDLEPSPPLAGVKRLTEVVGLGRSTSESQHSANLLADQRLSSTYHYGLGVTERFDYFEVDGGLQLIEIEEEREPDLPLPEQVLPLASEVTLGSPVAAQIGARYGRLGWDGPNPDRLRRPPSGLLRVAGPPAGGALALLVALGLLLRAWRRRPT